MEKIMVFTGNMQQYTRFNRRYNIDPNIVRYISSDIDLHGLPHGFSFMRHGTWYAHPDAAGIMAELSYYQAKEIGLDVVIAGDYLLME